MTLFTGFKEVGGQTNLTILIVLYFIANNHLNKKGLIDNFIAKVSQTIKIKNDCEVLKAAMDDFLY